MPLAELATQLEAKQLEYFTTLCKSGAFAMSFPNTYNRDTIGCNHADLCLWQNCKVFQLETGAFDEIAISSLRK